MPERDLFSRDDVRNILDGLTQTVDVVPPEAELYRIGYLRALRDVARICGMVRLEPVPRRTLPIIEANARQ